MNRTRCPWCGKRIDKAKDKDKTFWKNIGLGVSLLHKANCAHCGRMYGQFPVFSYLFKIDLLTILIVVLTFVFQSEILFVISIPILLFDFLLHVFMPYSKLNDKGKPCEENTDLCCKMVVLEKNAEIKSYELYFLNDCFDDFEPFVLASPIHIDHISKKDDTVSGEFLYMHEKNYDFIEKDSCDLYDTNMNRIAKIKFIADSHNENSALGMINSVCVRNSFFLTDLC